MDVGENVMEVENNLNIPSCFWAKKSDDGSLFKWLQLEQHLIDTMNVIGLLWEHWLSDSQRKLLINSAIPIDEEGTKNLIKFIGGSHDIGKLTPAFQLKKTSYKNTEDLDKILLEKIIAEGFADEDPGLTAMEQSHHSVASQTLLNNFGVKEDIASIAGGHHGKPVDDSSIIKKQLSSYSANYFIKEKSNDPIHIKWNNAQEELFKWILKRSGFSSVEELPIISQPGQVVIEGLLIMADWIASNENYFPLLDIQDSGENINQQKRLEYGWKKWFGTRPTPLLEEREVNDYFNERFGFQPRELQYKLVDIIQKSEDPGIFIVEAPMGVGKTEAALAAVEYLSSKTGNSGLFFGLPTQATSDGIFPRINSWLQGISLSVGEKQSLQLIHGKAALNSEFAELSRHIDQDGDMDSGVIVNQWFTGKKTAILDDYVVGTVDHFLLAALKQKHLALRHMGLSKKVVVIDEVHAYDAYMSQYLNRAVHWMGSYKVPVIILSATLPSKKRVELIESYLNGDGKYTIEVNQPKGWEETVAYPLITYIDNESIMQIHDFQPQEDKTIQIKKIQDDDILAILQDKLSEGGVAGIIVNTVKRAQQLYSELAAAFGEDLIEVLHSGFIATDRIDKEKHLLNMIGKDAERPFKEIIIGTQVIEQSLDINFDLLITDLAPMDLIIQRIGRLHRHPLSDRPKKLKEPVVYIVGTSDNFEFEEGSGFVYGKYLLIRTQYYLLDKINLPSHISPLVQKVYGEEDIFIEDDELKEIYINEKQKFYRLIDKKKNKAESYLLDEMNYYGREVSLIGWLKNDIRNSSEEKGFAQVRDSQESIEVIVVKKYGSGYGFVKESEDICNKIHEFAISKKLAAQTLKLPRVLCMPCNIDKTIEELEEYNNKKLPEWQKEPWLKGSLGIILDDGNNFELLDYNLHYDEKLGLTYERVVEDGEI